MGKFLKGSLLFLSVFALLSLPGLVMQADEEVAVVKVSFPEPVKREVASVGQTPGKDCMPQVAWRNVCERDLKGQRLCKKDLKQIYLACKNHK